MRTTVSNIDISKCKAGDKPCDMLRLQAGERWFTVTGPLPLQGPSTPVKDWLTTHSGELVRLPLIPYLTSPDPLVALSFMVQIGAMVVAHTRKPRRLHLAIGHPVQEVRQSGRALRIWLGIGVECGPE